MKKILSLLSTFGLMASSSTVTTSCSIFDLLSSDKFIEIMRKDKMKVEQELDIAEIIAHDFMKFQEFRKTIVAIALKEGFKENSVTETTTLTSSDEEVIEVLINYQDYPYKIKALSPGVATIKYTLSYVHDGEEVGKLTLKNEITVERE